MKKKKSRQISADSLTNEERLKLSEEIHNERVRRGDIKPCPEDIDFKKIAWLQNKWDRTYGKDFEKLIKKPFNLDDFKEWYNRSIKLWKEIKEAEGLSVCMKYGCMKNARSRSKYCSDAHRDNEKSRNYRMNNPEKKRSSEQKYWAQAQRLEDGITEDEYNKLKKDRSNNK